MISRSPPRFTLLWRQCWSLYWWRRYCWSLAGIAMVLTLGRVGLAPLLPPDPPQPLPNTLAVPGWTLWSSQPVVLTLPATDYHQFQTGRRYRLSRQGHTVTITVLAVTHTNGNAPPWLAQRWQLTPDHGATAIDHPSGRGHYHWVDYDSADDAEPSTTEFSTTDPISEAPAAPQLVSCLHADGTGTTSAAQAEAHALAQLTRLPNLARWLVGRQPIPDRRCWWVRLTLVAPPTTTSTDPVAPHAVLRQVWDTLPLPPEGE